MDDPFALLCLQADWGADEAIDLEPIDRLRPIESDPRPSPRSFAPKAVVSRPLPQGTAAERAAVVAAEAATLDELRIALAGFDGCALADTASNLVFAEGNSASRTLIIGEAPGRDEDRGGHPFAGPEGHLLDQMLLSIGLTRTALMLTPLLPWRPPGGRPPSPAEIAICLPFLYRLIALVKPLRLVLFGSAPARVILPQGQNRRRGQRGWIDTNLPGLDLALPVLTVPGLADMLKNPLARRDAWTGLRLLRRAMDQDQT